MEQQEGVQYEAGAEGDTSVPENLVEERVQTEVDVDSKIDVQQYSEAKFDEATAGQTAQNAEEVQGVQRLEVGQNVNRAGRIYNNTVAIPISELFAMNSVQRYQGNRTLNLHDVNRVIVNADGNIQHNNEHTQLISQIINAEPDNYKVKVICDRPNANFSFHVHNKHVMEPNSCLDVEMIYENSIENNGVVDICITLRYTQPRNIELNSELEQENGLNANNIMNIDNNNQEYTDILSMKYLDQPVQRQNLRTISPPGDEIMINVEHTDDNAPLSNYIEFITDMFTISVNLLRSAENRVPDVIAAIYNNRATKTRVYVLVKPVPANTDDDNDSSEDMSSDDSGIVTKDSSSEGAANEN